MPVSMTSSSGYLEHSDNNGTDNTICVFGVFFPYTHVSYQG